MFYSLQSLPKYSNRLITKKNTQSCCKGLEHCVSIYYVCKITFKKCCFAMKALLSKINFSHGTIKVKTTKGISFVV